MAESVRSSAQLVAIATGIIALGATSACRERPPSHASLATVSAGELAELCSGDSLRPVTAAPAEGLWLYERPSSGERIAASIGPIRSDDRALVITRPVETVEVTAGGDTLRHRVDAARVSLELLPLPRHEPLGGGSADSAVSAQPAATYSPSALVRLAAYEPCLVSDRGPRIRYLRRDPAGRIVTDVMLTRASGR